MMAEGTTFRQLLVARGCQGAASAAIMSGGLSLIAETQPAHSRGRSLALAYTGLALGVLSGPLVGGLLFERLGRRRTFYLAGSVVLVNALAQMPLLYEPPASLLAPERARATRAPSPPGSKGGADKAPASSANAYLRLLSHPHVLAVCVMRR
jgi:MFS family permease